MYFMHLCIFLQGNKLVQEKKWDRAIECYTRAIELFKNDAIYYANRGLCYLKKEKYLNFI